MLEEVKDVVEGTSLDIELRRDDEVDVGVVRLLLLGLDDEIVKVDRLVVEPPLLLEVMVRSVSELVGRSDASSSLVVIGLSESSVRLGTGVAVWNGAGKDSSSGPGSIACRLTCLRGESIIAKFLERPSPE